MKIILVKNNHKLSFDSESSAACFLQDCGCTENNLQIIADNMLQITQDMGIKIDYIIE